MSSDLFRSPGEEHLGSNRESPDYLKRRPVQRRGGGGARPPKKLPLEESNAQSEWEPENVGPETIQEEARAPHKQINISNLKWGGEKGFFNRKIKVSAEAEISEEYRHLKSIQFTLYSLSSNGEKERIENQSGTLNSQGYAETELTLFYPSTRKTDGLPEMGTYVFTAQHKYSSIAESASLSVERVHCKDQPDFAPADIFGTCPYYTWRNENFVSRHGGCPRKPPEYYLSYGHKYCVRFSTETAPKLSARGKRWLIEARLRLQRAIENKLKEDGTVELDGKRFKSFAFGTHSSAYWDAGLQELPLTDLIQIGFTPDLREWKDDESRKQAYDIAGRLVEVRVHDIDEAVKQRTQEVTEYFRKILK